MKRYLKHSDITQVAADALIYSTNVRLAMTGGVGAALLRQFGIGVQITLQDASFGSGRQMAEVGEVFETSIDRSPWKTVFHTIATDELYRTDPNVVRSILLSSFRRCAELGDISSIVCSPLGAGYGDLELSTFLNIASSVCDEFEKTSIHEFSVVVYDEGEYKVLCDVAVEIGGWIQKA